MKFSLSQELREALKTRAVAEDSSEARVIRAALRAHLASSTTKEQP